MVIRDRSEERIGFQESAPYKPSYDLQTDFVMVYGIDKTMTKRIKEWKEKGYVVHLMTGVAWGEYQEYLYGKIDGRNHWDEAQKNKHESYIQHGKDVPYMVPTISYTNFLTERIRTAVDAGVEAIHLEEPEFWVDGGYSEAFKREWQIYYKEQWQPPHMSVDAEYRASHLKAYLYKRALDRLCSELKEYALVKYNRFLRFYVPTHSLINYTQWRIVSPESMLIDLPAIDGYIAQIWTGTSRTQNVYEGIRKERTFETAFLEYGMMQELVSGTDRRMWFLHDPIEDNPRHTWSDYRKNYFKTVVASLLHPEISHYEISPWPRRIFEGKYPTEEGTGVETIPGDYATTLLTVMHTLGNMNQQDIQVHGNSEKIGVLVADSMMYQRRNFSKEKNESIARYDGTDPDSVGNEEDIELLNFSHFYGLALPLLKRGLWVRPVQLDNVRRFSNYLKDYRLLILSYEFLKPEYPDLHNALAQWVKEGGVLIYVGDDSDPYHQVREWWNTGKHKYHFPREHLFECLGLASEHEQGIYPIGKGVLGYLKLSPDELTKLEKNGDFLRELLKNSLETYDQQIKLEEKNYFMLQRGPYRIAAVLDESISSVPLVIKGSFVDLFDPSLKVLEYIQLKPDENALLYDLNYDPKEQEVKIVAASSRIEEINQHENGFEMIVKGPEKIKAVARLFCPKQPIEAMLVIGNVRESIICEWHEGSKTVFLNYIHSSTEQTKVVVKW
jgi:mRNA-degrading endonuclease RelE of RelBE toxin-antitoxin system